MNKIEYKLITLALAFYFVVGLTPAHATYPGKAIIYLDSKESDALNFIKVQELVREKKFGDALAILEQKVKEFPNQATPVILKSFLLNEMGKYAEALAAMKMGYAMEKQHPAIYFGYCQIYRHLGVADLAERSCAITTRQHLEIADTYYEYAQTLTAMGKLKEANNELDRAALLDPKNSLYHYQRGLNFSRLNQFDKAEKAFLQSLSANPDDFDSAYLLAYNYAVDGKIELSKKHLAPIIDSNSNHPKVASAKILLDLIDKNRLNRLPDKNTILHEYYRKHSELLYKEGKYGLALLEIQAAANLEPNDPAIQEILVGLSSMLLRLTMAEKAANRLVQLAEANRNLMLQARSYQQLGDIKVMQGDLEGAGKHYEKALSLGDPNNLAKISLAEFPQDLNDFKGKKKPLENCIDQEVLNRHGAISAHLCINPIEGFNRQGEIFAHYGMYKRAIALYSTVQKMNPHHITSMLNAGTAYYNSGEHNRAISILEKTLLSYPNHRYIGAHQLLLAKVYVKKGDLEAGLNRLIQLVKMDARFRTVIQTDSAFDALRDTQGYNENFR